MHSQWKCKSRGTPQGRTQGTEGQKQPVVADITNVHSNEAELEAITLESKRERKWGEKMVPCAKNYQSPRYTRHQRQARLEEGI